MTGRVPELQESESLWDLATLDALAKEVGGRVEVRFWMQMPEPNTPQDLAALDELREERDQARAVAAETQEWLDVALTALGVGTVFDIPGWRERPDA